MYDPVLVVEIKFFDFANLAVARREREIPNVAERAKHG
jgi:hypothetical protein